MALISAVFSVVSGVVGAIGAIASANAQAEAAEQNARIQDYNRQVSERNKAATNAATDAEAAEKRRENARTMASMRAAYGASGLAMSGSSLDVLEDTAYEQELDVEKVRYRGHVKAVGYTDEAANYGMKSALAMSEAKNARTSGTISAAASFFGGVGQGVQTLARAGYSIG